MLLTEAEVGNLIDAGVDTHQERVDNGIRLLDSVRPGWWKEIDPSILDIANADTCILAQLYGGYTVGKQKLGIYCAWAYGFSGEGLTHLWRRVIAARVAIMRSWEQADAAAQ